MARRWNFYTSKEIKPKGWLKRQLQIQADGGCKDYFGDTVSF